MTKRVIMAALLAFGLAGSAQAAAFFSVGATVDATTPGGRDPGLKASEQAVYKFERSPNADSWYYDSSLSSGTFGYSTVSANAPAGDTSRYMSVSSGYVTFDLRSYLATRTTPALGLSVYVGSIEASNKIDLIGQGLNGALDLNSPLLSILGSQLISGTGVSSVNRRVYLNFGTLDNVGALRFSATTGAFEFDTIAFSSATYSNPNSAADQAGDLLNGGIGNVSVPNNISGVPEPSSWATIMLGFGVLGGMLRSRRRERTHAAI